MQDRFKFRFWDTEEKVMIEWDCVCQSAFNYTREEGNKLERYGLMYLVFTASLRFIPLQCTGLKDKNGKLIYEGDIFTVLHCGEKKVVVFWDDEQARFRVKNAAHNLLQTMRSDYIEVVGNIYENPELLKEVRGE